MTIRGNHHITDLKVHLVFVVKYRKKLISPSVKSILTQSFEETCKKLDCRLLECNGEEDHIHLLIEYLPTIPISVLVHRLKGTSSCLVRKYPSISTLHWMSHFWSSGYYATSCGGASLEKIKQYIENQDRLISPG